MNNYFDFYRAEKAKNKPINPHQIITPGSTPYEKNGKKEWDAHDNTTRDFLYALPTDQKEKYDKCYHEILRYIIGRYEEKYNYAYDDKQNGKSVKEILAQGGTVKGKRTVGIGFNMDDNKKDASGKIKDTSRKLWNGAFNDEIDFVINYHFLKLDQ